MARAVLLACLAAFSAAQTVPATTTTYDTRACVAPFDAAHGFVFCDASRSLDERINDLIARVWNTSVATIPMLLTARNKGQSALPLLGVPEFDYGMNAIHGIQSSCVSDAAGTHCPTSFMNPVNFGNAWNKSLARELGVTLGIEGRALWLAGAVEQSPRNHIGLDAWSPNINIARDPRWGRSCEVASEDPMINGDFGAQYSLGIQYPGPDAEHVAVVSTLKHWDAYSLEDSDGARRYDFNAVVSPYALASTYFPAFAASVGEGGALGVMCSYNAVNGIPTCASPMLTRVLRDVWGFRGYVTSDSGALENIHGNHNYTNSSINTVPVALRDGQTDVCSGGIYSDNLLPALDAGLIAREDIDLALYHTFRMRFQMGLFDPPAAQPYWSLPLSSVGTPAALALNLLATQESMVLLKHDGATLPLPRGKNIAVIGPHANATAALVGNYLGQLCPDNTFACINSPFHEIRLANAGGNTTLTFGSSITSADPGGIAAAVAAATAADAVVLLLGIDGSVENEMRDRTSIDLPAAQHALAAAVAAVGRPTVIVLLHGGSVDVTAERDDARVGAIVDAGYPGFLGGTVIAQTLFGDNDHVGGKLAMTAYAESFVNASLMSDMELDTGVGRGYRFYTGEPVFRFGHGLALTTFTLTLASGPASGALVTETEPSTALAYVVRVTNTGARTGDEVVQAYFAPQSTPAQPKSKLLKQLFAYQRVHLAPGASADVAFTVDSKTLRLVDRDSGDSVSTPGAFDVIFTNGVDETLHNAVTVAGAEVVVSRFPGAE
jgi:beta-D-xylosidase 4